MTGDHLAADRELLGSAIRAAGALALEHFQGERWHWYKGPGQVLTQADLDVDRLLRARILAARPEDGWLSEESPDNGSRHRGLVAAPPALHAELCERLARIARERTG